MNLQEAKDEIERYYQAITLLAGVPSIFIRCVPPDNDRTEFLVPTLFPEEGNIIKNYFVKQGCREIEGVVDVGPCLNYFKTFLELITIYAEESL